jgi:hypothetical protein
MADLAVEPGLTHDSERNARHGGSDCRTGDRRCDLRHRHQPEVLRNQDQTGCGHRADTWDDHVELLASGRIDQRTCRRGHQHAGYAADRHHRSDQPALPAMRQQKDTEKGTDARLHVGHEKVQRQQRPKAFKCRLA